MYETVKTVNNHEIYRMVGARKHYYVNTSYNRRICFKTIKEAAAFCLTF